MLSSLSTLALAATLASAIPLKALPARSDKTISLKFTKQASSGSSISTIQSSLTNTDLAYLISVEVGTPPQSLQLQLDTGSSDVWAFGPGSCGSSTCTGGTYDASQSSSAVEDTSLGEFQIAYFTPGSGVNGTYYTDNIVIGGVTITNQVIAEASSAVDVGNGIMGVGPQGLESDGGGYPSLLDTMVNDGLIAKRIFSLALDDINSASGEIVFGGYDASYQSSIVSLPIEAGISGDGPRYYVDWSSFSVTDGSGNSLYSSVSSSDSLPYPTVLDSGYSLSVLPNDIYDAVAQYFGVGSDGTISCDATSQYSGSFQFGFGAGPAVTINVDFANSIAVPAGDDTCLFGFEAAGSNPVISLGDTFLRSAFVVYDVDDSLIGLAQGAWTQ